MPRTEKQVAARNYYRDRAIVRKIARGEAILAVEHMTDHQLRRALTMHLNSLLETLYDSSDIAAARAIKMACETWQEIALRDAQGRLFGESLDQGADSK